MKFQNERKYFFALNVTMFSNFHKPYSDNRDFQVFKQRKVRGILYFQTVNCNFS